MTGPLAYSIVRRHMKHTSTGAFTRADGASRAPFSLPVPADETLVGWYQNPPPWEACLVGFTTKALYAINRKRIVRIAFEDITGYEDPKSKAEVTGVRILTRTGSHFVRVAGAFGPSGNRKDAYSFIMVIRALAPSEPVVVFHKKGDRD